MINNEIKDKVALNLSLTEIEIKEIKESCLNFLKNHKDPSSVLSLIYNESWNSLNKLYAAFYFGWLLEFIDLDPFMHLIVKTINKITNITEGFKPTLSIGNSLDIDEERGFKIFEHCMMLVKGKESKSEILKMIDSLKQPMNEKILSCFYIGRFLRFIASSKGNI